MPSSFSNLLIGLWPIVSAMAPFVLAAGVWYLRTQFATKGDFDALSAKVTELTTAVQAGQVSIKHLTDEQDSAPTRIDLLNKIAALEGRTSGIEAGMHGIQSQLATTNDYLQILVERGIKQ